MTTADVQVTAPFTLPPAAFAPLPLGIRHALRRCCERWLALPALNAVYRQSRPTAERPSFFEQALRALSVEIEVFDEDVRRIPAAGPLIAVANHPLGGLDGIILAALLQRVRPDVRLMANYLLGCMPEMHEACIFVDPFGGPAAADRNRGALRAAMRWVAAGGALGVFPAGEVSHFTLRRGALTDGPWDGSIAALVRRTRATVVPIYFHGRNGRLFQLAGLVHPRLRTAMLPREFLHCRGRTVRVEIGSPIPFARSLRCTDGSEVESHRDKDARLTEYLRLRTYILKGRVGRPPRPAPRSGRGAARKAAAQPIIDESPASVLAAEIQALPGERCLAAGGPLRVYWGTESELPNVLREIGRLRELTFRRVGEGTGRPVDLDRFDQHYLHLFVWHVERRQLVGAYRMGQTDVLLDRFGAEGLYTNTLFRYQRRLLRQLNPALELGRSFVIPEYQRDYAPLLLLWKGIGRYVVAHPRYRRLFGAVSISDEFQSMTKQLLMSFLKVHRFDQGMAALLEPRNPPKARPWRDVDERRLATLVSDVADVEELVGEIESNRRSVPVLLRQYLKLNARLIGFNVDPDFGDVLDGLVFVDLLAVDRAILNRYMEKEGAAAFHAFHGNSEQPSRRSAI